MHRSLISLLARRWRVTVPLLVVTVGIASLVQQAAPSAYLATGTVMLASPAHDPTRSSASAAALDAVVAELQGPDVADDVAAPGATVIVTRTDRHTVFVSSSAEHGRAAERSVTGAIAWLERELEERQTEAGVPDNDRLAGRLLTPTVVARLGDDGNRAADAVVWIEGAGGDEDNPYDASPTTARLLMLALSGSDGRQLLEQRLAPDVSYDIGFDPYGAIASLEIVTRGPDAADVTRAFDDIAALMDLELDARQSRAQVPSSRRIFVDVLARPSTVEDTRPIVGPLTVLILLLGTAAAGAVGASNVHRAERDGHDTSLESSSSAGARLYGNGIPTTAARAVGRDALRG